MQTKQSTKENSKRKAPAAISSKVENKKKILSSGTIVALIILMTPFLLYVHHIVPPVESIDTFIGTIDSNFYEDIQILTWVVLGKVTPLILLLFWFFTNKHWWYHVIIVPIVVFSYQLITAINEDVAFLDVDDIYFLVPVIAIIAAFSYSIRIKIFDSLYGVDLDQELKRVRWNGKIVKVPANSPLDLEEVGDDEVDEDDEHDEDKEPMWMA